MTLMVYLTRQGKLTRYNLRKFTELPFQVKKINSIKISHIVAIQNKNSW